MEIVNPLAGSLAQSANVTRQQSADKTQQIRRAQTLRKDVAAADTFEHQVESTEELTPIHDEQRQSDQQRRRKPKRSPNDPPQPDVEEPPRIDVVA
jgi:hypothetical protein